MPPVALPVDTQVMNMPSPPAIVRFWSPGGARTVAAVSTLPKLTAVPEVELRLDYLRVALPARGAVRAAVRVGEALPFRAGAGDFVLDDDEE